MLLAIDTSVGTSVAIVRGAADVLAVRESRDTRGHAETIGTFLAECLADSGVAATALSGVVAGMGPGPFTGLRVGIAAAHAFALGARVPLLPVVSHDAIAFAEYRHAGHGPLVVTTDARRREVFWTAYSGTDEAGVPVRVAGPALAAADALEATVPGFGGYRVVAADTVPPAALGLLAATMAAAARPFAADAPFYLRSPDVTVSAGPKRVTS